MALITIKGHEFEAVVARDAFGRRAAQYKNNIIRTLGMIGLTADDVDIELEPIAIKNVLASATWFAEGYRMYYSYKAAGRFVDNLYVVSKVIELEVADLLAERKTFEEFLSAFTEKEDVEAARKEARELLGVGHDVLDLEHIDKKYKELAKKHHPDMPTGDNETFKRLNMAHKILRRELR